MSANNTNVFFLTTAKKNKKKVLNKSIQEQRAMKLPNLGILNDFDSAQLNH